MKIRCVGLMLLYFVIADLAIRNRPRPLIWKRFSAS
jgi:hypothetical protein